MQDPFETNSQQEDQAVNWSEEELYFGRLYKVQQLLSELNSELDSARKEYFIVDIIDNLKVDEQLAKLSTFLTKYNNNNSSNTPVMAGIANIQKLVENLTEMLQKTETAANANPADRTLSGSAHANSSSSYEPDRLSVTPSYMNSHTNHISQPNMKPRPSTAPPQVKVIPTNPNSSHHPSRLVAQFLPTGIPENLRPDPSKIVTELNSAISSKHPGKPVKIVAASFNTQGNLILSTRSDQTASELIKYRDTILPVLSNISDTHQIELREDSKWFKIQIDAVNTSYISIGNERLPIVAEAVHEELLACNPQYALMIDSIVSKPRWLRSKEELLTNHRSSLVFASTDETSARLLLKHRSLAAFGKHCSIRAFQDRPPITQCRNCWRLDHTSHQCKETQRCRLCS
jgi:hypothetical protein